MNHGLTGAAKQLVQAALQYPTEHWDSCSHLCSVLGCPQGPPGCRSTQRIFGSRRRIGRLHEVVAAGAAPDRARQPCTGNPRSPLESRPVDEASKVTAPGSACQVGNQGPQTVDQTLTEEEGVERASCVGNSVPHGAVSAPNVAIETSHDVGNEVPRRRRRRKSSLNNIQTGVAPSDSKSRARAPPTRPVEEC
ncbi:hypothetical protein PC116_g26517 [Phytophthora cactorum]|nr:hypothetical protein PC114_g18087 [Phytophthora cactorum]KAG2998451.1 hypothetical protein PC119_g17430 [Phytophthora cactorum]KAG3145116.1 hypothetical protein C6341_g18511 [Phytophthora cactorum]KAG4037080.1 hypothetical protein PC123_g27352 [Phytophthora cactorum]KAG4225041.1 hypothetical protein PC116_g26517 [Phytophthora cactorum]